MKRVYETFVLVGIAVALPSCLESEEEIWINADASGAGRIAITVPAAATSLHGGEAGLKTLADDFLKSSPAFSSYLVETKSVGKRITISAAFTFADARDFLDSSFTENLDRLPGGGSEFLGTTQMEFRGLNIDFSRRTELSKAIPGAIFFPQSKLAGHQVKTTIHLPKSATSHNATSTADGGRTLIWVTPLETALKSPVETRFTMPIPIPWVTVSVIAIVIVVLLCTLAYYIRSRKKAFSSPRATIS